MGIRSRDLFFLLFCCPSVRLSVSLSCFFCCVVRVEREPRLDCALFSRLFDVCYTRCNALPLIACARMCVCVCLCGAMLFESLLLRI